MQLFPLFNRQFIMRLLYRWIIVLIILILAIGLFFLQLEISILKPYVWRAAEKIPGLGGLIGLPAAFVSSFIVAFLHTKTDNKKNYPRVYWFTYFIPAALLFSADYASYRYYINYTTQRDQDRRQRLEQEVKENDHPSYTALAEMYKNGWGGSQDTDRATELYQKACDEEPSNSSTIQACKEIKNYTKLRLLLKGSTDPYDMVTLATLYETGLGGPQDIPKAKELYQKACPSKDDFICTNYKPFR